MHPARLLTKQYARCTNICLNSYIVIQVQSKEMTKTIFNISLLLLTGFISNAQYAPQYPLSGNDAIAATDSRFEAWASGCTVQRGWKDIADTSLGLVSAGADANAIGAPSQSIVSLGDSGVAILTFDYTIKNGEGPDFAVFENGFANPDNDTFAYLELAFVEVSSDGVHYFRFPASSSMQDTAQIDNFTYVDARNYHNLAGKYINGYGTPFDLEELKNINGLDINQISHIRLVDVIGSINPANASRDKDEHIINEAYPTAFASGGFDLNAIGVIHSNKPTSISAQPNLPSFKIYPNPTSDILHLEGIQGNTYHYTLTDINGRNIMHHSFETKLTLSLKEQVPGIYLLLVQNGFQQDLIKIIKK